MNILSDICKVCPNQYKLVPPRILGVIKKSDYLIIGESPKDEDLALKQLFTGKVGNLLFKDLEQIGLERRQFAIINAILCPFKNPTKHTSQIKKVMAACRPAIETLIKNICPKYIFCFGNIAASQVLNKWVTMKSVRGVAQYVPEFDATAFFFWHPAIY